MPFKTIIENAGGKSELALQKLLDSDDGCCYDAVSATIVKATEAGIIDPVKVVRCSLQNACSAASILLTSNYAIIEK